LNWRERWIEPKAAWIAAGTVAVIVYGSLYPFQFQPRAASGGPVRALLATWHAATSRGDLIANVLLYIPFGFFVFRSLSRPASFLRCMIVVAAGSLLSIAMELTQFYEPSRDSAMTDVYANTAGALSGAIAGAIFRIDLRLAKTSNLAKRPFVALLVASWLGYRLFPFVPVIDLHKYWAALKPLLFSPTLHPIDLYTHVVIWLAIALLFEALFGTARSRLAILLFVPAVLFARVLIEGTVLSPAEVVGGALAIPAWVALSRFHPRAAVVATLLVSCL
jgi:VanZ family protein